MRHIVLISLLFASPLAVACSHDMVFSVPDLQDSDAFVQSLAESKGKSPKPFSLQALFSEPHHIHKHEHEDKAIDSKNDAETQSSQYRRAD